MSGHRITVCRRDGLTPGGARRFDVEGVAVAVVRIEDEVYAIVHRTDPQRVAKCRASRLIMLAIASTSTAQSSSRQRRSDGSAFVQPGGRRDRQGIEAKTKRITSRLQRTERQTDVECAGLECDGTQRILWRQFLQWLCR